MGKQKQILQNARQLANQGEFQKALQTIYDLEGDSDLMENESFVSKMGDAENFIRELEKAHLTEQGKKIPVFLNNIQEFVNQHKYKEAYDIINMLKSLNYNANEIEKLKESLFQSSLQYIQELANQYKYKEAYDIINMLKNLNATWTNKIQFEKLKESFVTWSNKIEKTEESLVQLQLKYVQQLANQGKYKEAYDLLNEIKALSISTSEPSASEIKKLEESLIKPQLDNVKQLANQHKYTEAYDILNRLKTLQVKQAWALEIQIKQQEAAWKKAQEPVAPVEQKWLFIKQIPGAESVEKSDWKIQDQQLLLNLDATELMTQETFADLIKEAKDKNLPFILVMVQSGDPAKFFPYFFGVDVLKSFMEDWRSEEKPEDKKFINPMNREKVTNIEIYVMGDDKTLHLLKDKVDINYLGKLIDYKGPIYEPSLGRRIHNYEFKPELTKSGEAQNFINNLYKEEGKSALFNL